MPGGPKLVHLTFNMNEGPKVKIRKIDFVGNKAISDGTLKRQMKENKERGLGLVHSDLVHRIGDAAPTRKTKFDEDAEKVVEYYRDHGYMRARVGEPEAEGRSRTPKDKKTRWVELRIPVTEGPRYKVGELRRRRQHGRQDRGAEAAVQAEAGRVLQREADPQGPEKARESTAPAATSSSPASRTSSSATTRTRTSPRRRRR